MINFFRNNGLYFAWVIALLCLIISLFSSEVFALPVCHLCWYQRICLYPLSLILGIAAYCDDRGIVRYTLPLVIIAFLLGLLQYLQQMIPSFSPIELCGQGPSCRQIHFLWLGFVTYPFLTMLASFTVACLLIMSRCKQTQH